MKLHGLEVHPAAESYPMMGDAELRALGEDLKKNGQQSPLLLFDGMLLDGRNRVEAANRAGIMVATLSRKTVEGNPWDLAWSMNGERRHMAQVQRAAIYLLTQKESGEYERLRAEKARSKATRGSASRGPGTGPTDSRERKTNAVMAKAAHVGHSTMEEVIAEAKKAPDNLRKMAAGTHKPKPRRKKLKPVYHLEIKAARTHNALADLLTALDKTMKICPPQDFVDRVGKRRDAPDLQVITMFDEMIAWMKEIRNGLAPMVIHCGSKK